MQEKGCIALVISSYSLIIFIAIMQRGERMGDLIDRQAAINAISCDITITGRQNAELVAATIGAFADRIKALPSAQPERKNGHWEMAPDPYGFFKEIPTCSECGCTTEMRKTYKFCPNCGADMRGTWNEHK